MSVNHRPSSQERRALLDDQPQPSSYGTTTTTNDVNLESVEDPPPPPPPESTERSLQPVDNSSRSDHWLIFVGLWSGVMIYAFDSTVVATLTTRIASEFNASHKSSYIGSSFMFSVCCFITLHGRLSDSLGRKWSMLLALSLLGWGTMWCGMAQSINSLIAARVISGIGGGGVIILTNIIVSDLVPRSQRGVYQGYTNVFFGVGTSLGGPIGGWITDNFGWRLVFYIQAPILIFSIVVVAIKVDIPLSEELQNQTVFEKLRQIDYFGSITLAGGLGCFLFALDFRATDELQWGHPLVISLLFSSAICFVLFILTEKYWATNPVISLRVLCQKQSLAVSLSSLALSISVFSMLYAAPIFYSTVRSLPPTVVGLYLLPYSLIIPFGSLYAGWCMRTTGRLYLITIQSAFFTLLPCVLSSFWTTRTPEFRLWLDLSPQGFGFSSVVTTVLIAMIASIRKEDVPMGIAILYVFRTTGQAVGISLGGVVLQTVLLKRLRAKIHGPGSEEIIYSIRHSAQIIPSLEPHIRHAAIECYADALRVVFICQAAIGLVGFLACLLIQEKLDVVAPTPRDPESGNRDESQ